MEFRQFSFFLAGLILVSIGASIEDSLSNLDIPDLTPPIPVDLVHLIDQSGSVDDDAYEKALEFALDISLTLGDMIGYDGANTPGMRVSVLGFGCKMSTTKDQTDFLLYQENELEAIVSKFSAVKQNDSPGYGRTCLRYALDHMEKAILEENIDGSLTPERKTVILLYTDGQDGDFGWPLVATSPLFNNDRDVEVFALGVEKKNTKKIINRIVRDESHVYSTFSPSAMQEIATRLNTFIIDPFNFKVKITKETSSGNVDFDPETVVDITFGNRLLIFFEPLTELQVEIAGVDNPATTIDDKYSLLERYKMEYLDTDSRLTVISMLRDNSTTVAEVDSYLNQKNNSHEIFSNETGDLYICSFRTLMGESIVLASSIDSNVLFCEIPNELFSFVGFEDVSIQLYKTNGIAPILSRHSLDSLVKSFQFLAHWRPEINSIISSDASISNSCNVINDYLILNGESVQVLMDSPKWSINNVSCDFVIGELSFALEVVFEGALVKCIFQKDILFYEHSLVTGGTSLAGTVKFQTIEPSSKQIITASHEVVFQPKDSAPCIFPEKPEPICFGEDFSTSISFAKDFSLFGADSFDKQLLTCFLGDSPVKTFFQEMEDSVLVACSIDSTEMYNEQPISIVLSSVSHQILDIFGLQRVHLKSKDACIQVNQENLLSDCMQNELYSGQIGFSGVTIQSFISKGSQLECEHIGEVSLVKSDAIIEAGTAYCYIKKAVVADQVRIAIKGTNIRLDEFLVKNVPDTCINFEIIVNNQSKASESICYSDDIAVLIEAQQVYDNLANFRCKWSTSSYTQITSLVNESSVVKCVFPKNPNLMGPGGISLSLVSSVGLDFNVQVFELPRISSCIDAFSLTERETHEGSDICYSPVHSIGFSGNALSSFNDPHNLFCQYYTYTNEPTIDTIGLSAGEFTCVSAFETNLRSIGLVYKNTDSQLWELAHHDIPLSTAQCAFVERFFNCTESLVFYLEGETIESLFYTPDDIEVLCKLQIRNKHSEQLYSPILLHNSSQAKCEFHSSEYTSAEPNELKLSSFSLVGKRNNQTIYELSSFSNFTESQGCILESFEHNDVIENARYMNGLFGTGVMFAVGGFFAYSRKRKYWPDGKSNYSQTTGSSVSFHEDLVESITDKELLLYNSSGFEVNDVVEVTLETSLLDSCHKVGIIINKQLKSIGMVYEVKLLDEDNVIVTDLLENDLRIVRFKSGDTVLVLDEEVENQWNESTVVKFNPRSRCCDVRQGYNRLNDVPLTCIRRIEGHDGVVKDQTLDEEISVKVPSVLEQNQTGPPKNLLCDYGILKKTHLKKYRTTEPACTRSRIKSDAKRVKFASSIPPPKFKSTPAISHNLIVAKSFYEDNNSADYKEITSDEYEICVDISLGLGICWVFDRNDGSILVGKFVQTSSGVKGSLEKSGKVQIKDKLLEINGIQVTQYRSLSQVKDIIRKAKKQDKNVNFRFEKKTLL